MTDDVVVVVVAAAAAVAAAAIAGLTRRVRMSGGTVNLYLGVWVGIGEGLVPLRSMQRQISVE